MSNRTRKRRQIGCSTCSGLSPTRRFVGGPESETVSSASDVVVLVSDTVLPFRGVVGGNQTQRETALTPCATGLQLQHLSMKLQPFVVCCQVGISSLGRLWKWAALADFYHRKTATVLANVSWLLLTLGGCLWRSYTGDCSPHMTIIDCI
eukprot:6489504-Amphidinium_carterae.1